MTTDAAAKPNKPKVTVSFTPVFELRVRGETRVEEPYDPAKDTHGLGPLPRCPDDGGMVSALLTWLHAQDINTAVAGGQIGGGYLIGLYGLADMPKIMNKCFELGLIPVDVNDHPRRS